MATPSAEVASSSAAAWWWSTGTAEIGPEIPEGRLLLLGGRRALVAPDGSLQNERVAAPEPLDDLALATTAEGPRLVAWGMAGAYAFPEPLGAPRSTAMPRPSREEREVVAEPPPASGEAPLLRWVRLTHRDPLRAAISEGVLRRDGDAVVASEGHLARVDLRSGNVRELRRAGPATWARVVRAGDDAYLVSAAGEQVTVNQLDVDSDLSVGARVIASWRSPGEPPEPVDIVETSPSGGIMVRGVCGTRDAAANTRAAFCVRQPNGSWATVSIGEGFHAAGPMANGGIAVLHIPTKGEYRLQTVDARGNSRIVASIQTDEPLEDATVDRGAPRRLLVIESREHTLSLAFENGHLIHVDERGAVSFLEPRGDWAELGAGCGLAGGPSGELFVSGDNGRTWHPTNPPTMTPELRQSRADAVVTEVGAVVWQQIRIGWN